ncbi:AlkZ-related protein [Allorhodopirellula heiligendammensis]|uniref:Uncharacterized protein n=1 Tax=Allorhodopirellula heiligendammensis TaxID=2714739 RepID=A0A5C6BTD7_9BACT|nr:hypothetical protein [Allorhodopirellula heiligendammensis]TWU15473.1 hypothetical protein Poly21_26690 [Allorhodopirellula heiligendammensis]
MQIIKTFEEAFQFVMDRKVCTIFGSKGSPHPSLWDNTALSEKKPKAGGWSPKVMAVWDWKTRIPQTYPELVYYGKIKGGDAVMMEMQYFRETHYPASFKPVSDLDELAQQVYEFIRLEPAFTGLLRKRAIEQFGCTKSQFDTAIKKLQISLNIVRSNDPSLKNDFWLSMREVHLDLVNRYEINSSNEPAKDGRADR